MGRVLDELRRRKAQGLSLGGQPMGAAERRVARATAQAPPADDPWLRSRVIDGKQMMPFVRYEGEFNEPVEANPLLDPLNFIPGVRTAQAVGAVGPVAVRNPVIRGVGGALGGFIGHLPLVGAPLRGAVRGFARSRAEALAAKAVESGTETLPTLARGGTAAMQPIIGRAEAEAFRQGGLPAVEAVRAATAPVAEELGSAAARTIPKGHRAVSGYIQRIGKRAKPKGKVAGKIEPKVGSAESRVAKAPKGRVTAQERLAARPKAEPRRVSGGPAMEVPGALEAQLQASVRGGAQLRALEAQLGRALTPDEELAAWQALRQAMGQ